MDKPKTMQEAIKAHEAAGGYFFSQGALDFFTSRILHNTYDPETGLFITSEVMGLERDEPMTFAVRQIDLGRPNVVTTIGDRHETLEGAVEALRVEAMG